MAVSDVVARLDFVQRRHRGLAVPFAVWRKFGEDDAGKLASLIAYFAFFSIFPLLLALVTILGYVLAGHPDWQHTVYDSALGNFPIIGKHSKLEPLEGNVFSLVVGLLLAVWSGLAVANMAQRALNRVHEVPALEQPGFLPRLLRSVVLVLVVGLGMIVTTLLQGVLSGTDSYGLHLGWATQVLGGVVGVLLNAALFAVAFRIGTVRPLGWRRTLPGAVVVALFWFALQKVGTELINRKINGSTGTYGTFALVIGLLFWFYLVAQVTLYCAELNVVLARRLYPRALSALLDQKAVTDADFRLHEGYPELNRRAKNVEVDVRRVAETGAPGPEAGSPE